MNRYICWSAIILLGSVTTAAAQQAPAKKAPTAGGTQAGVTGSWDVKSMVGPKDSVVTTFVLTIAPDGKSASMKSPNRDPIPVRVLAIGGDSLVTEAGPYPSILRAGQTVNSLRSTAHYKSNTMTGTFEARYANGDVLKGKTQGTRAK